MPVAGMGRELLAVWYDPYGKTVRWRQDSVLELSQNMALVNSASIDDHTVWTEAEIGEDYDWESDDESEGSGSSEG